MTRERTDTPNHLRETTCAKLLIVSRVALTAFSTGEIDQPHPP
jgi:hypothetical protein